MTDKMKIWKFCTRGGKEIIICPYCFRTLGIIKPTGFIELKQNCRHYEWHLNVKGGVAHMYVRDGEIYSLHPREWFVEILQRKKEGRA